MKCFLKVVHGIIFLILLCVLLDGNAQEQIFDTDSTRVSVLPGKDSVFLNPVYFIKDHSCNFYFGCLLKTPVCNDTLCQLVQLKIFWDLVGNYSRFDTLDAYPLTKNDDLPFTTQDYWKLQSTLADDNSILGRRSENELLDTTKTRYSEKIDAMTGATALQIKNSVVEGALYTTYTLWHLVNGSIQKRLKDFTIENYNGQIENQLLGNPDPNLIIVALQQWGDQEYHDRFPEIIAIMKKGHPLVNFYIAKNLPASLLVKKSCINSIESIWEGFDSNTKSVLSGYIRKN